MTRVELLATGDELLSGSLVDTNSPWLMEKLTGLGLPVWRKTIVGDDRKALIAALRAASTESDVVVVSGGLGPTSDDLTAEVVAEMASVALRLDQGVLDSIAARLKTRGITTISPNNRKQALVPQGSIVIANRFGTAPMFEFSFGRARFFFLPGVPREYFGLASEELFPRLRELSASAPPQRLKLLRTYGVPESQLDARLADLPKLFPGLTLGYRTTLPENHAKLLMSGEGVDGRLAAATAEAHRRLGLDCFGEDETTFSEAVNAALLAHGATLAVAESLTAGSIAAIVAETPGASRVLRGGFVAYSEEMKRSLLGVPSAVLTAHGAVSAEVAEAMALNARDRTGATYAVSSTGLAGPSGDGKHPVGTVFTALAAPSGVLVKQHLFAGGLGGDRVRVRESAAYAALDALRRALLTTD